MTKNTKVKKVIPAKDSDLIRTDRPDIAENRADDSTFIARVQRPQLNNKAAYVLRAWENGADLKDIVRNSGLAVSAVYKLIGLDAMADKSRYDTLCEYKNNLIMKQR